MPVVHELKTDALKNLKKRYKKPEMKSLMVQATLLDPRLKDFLHVALADRADHVDFAKKELLANHLIEKIWKLAAEGGLAPLFSTSVENEGDDEDVEPPKKRLKGIRLIYIIIYIYNISLFRLLLVY